MAQTGQSFAPEAQTAQIREVAASVPVVEVKIANAFRHDRLCGGRPQAGGA